MSPPPLSPSTGELTTENVPAHFKAQLGAGAKDKVQMVVQRRIYCGAARSKKKQNASPWCRPSRKRRYKKVVVYINPPGDDTGFVHILKNYLNLIIRIPGLEITGMSVVKDPAKYWNMRIFFCHFSTVFVFVMLRLKYRCYACVIILLIMIC